MSRAAKPAASAPWEAHQRRTRMPCDRPRGGVKGHGAFDGPHSGRSVTHPGGVEGTGGRHHDRGQLRQDRLRCARAPSPRNAIPAGCEATDGPPSLRSVPAHIRIADGPGGANFTPTP